MTKLRNMRNVKRIAAVIGAAALAFSLAACGSQAGTVNVSEAITAEAAADYYGKILTGRVEAVEGNVITLTLGEWTETRPEMNGERPEMPEGEMPEMNGERPEMPEGEMPQMNGERPEMPEGEMPEMNGERPEMPQGEMPQMNGERPEMPEGEMPEMNGERPEMPQMAGSFTENGESVSFDLTGLTLKTQSGQEITEIELSSIEVGSIVVFQLNEDDGEASIYVLSAGENSQTASRPDGQAPDASASDSTGSDSSRPSRPGSSQSGSQPGGFGGSSSAVEGSAATTITEDADIQNETYTSTGDDENALKVDGAAVSLSGITVDKAAGSSSNAENGDFYGINAAVLAINGATLTITDAEISSSAQNGNGVFSYGSGTTVNISDSAITTTGDNSGGIQTTGGGTTNASNLTVDTSGNSSAAIRSDRGGGTVNVDEGTYTSNGYNSPAVYSTADITVENATLTANNSEALVIEGKNSITLTDCDVTGNMSDSKGASSDINVHNVMIYQSMSGDADVGTSSFTMTGGTLTALNGDMIYVTNTDCVITLKDVDLDIQDEENILLRVAGNDASHGWGTAGKNGANAVFTAVSQELSGDIIVDTISTLELTLSDGSTFTGTVNIVDNEDGGTAAEDNAVITIEEGCTWTLTGDCTVSSLTNKGTINFNGYTITLADGTVLSK